MLHMEAVTTDSTPPVEDPLAESLLALMFSILGGRFLVVPSYGNSTVPART